MQSDSVAKSVPRALNIREIIKYLNETLELVSQHVAASDLENPDSDAYRLFTMLFSIYAKPGSGFPRIENLGICLEQLTTTKIMDTHSQQQQLTQPDRMAKKWHPAPVRKQPRDLIAIPNLVSSDAMAKKMYHDELQNLATMEREATADFLKSEFDDSVKNAALAVNASRKIMHKNYAPKKVTNRGIETEEIDKKIQNLKFMLADTSSNYASKN